MGMGMRMWRGWVEGMGRRWGCGGDGMGVCEGGEGEGVGWDGCVKEVRV